MIAPDKLQAILLATFPEARIDIEDLTGTQDHFKATVIARQFAGKSRIERHKMVYDALREEMKGAIHALALTTKAPDEQ